MSLDLSKYDTNDLGLELIKRFEGFRADWYYCPAGVLTIGYGETGKLPDGLEAPITRKQAEGLLRIRLDEVYEKVLEHRVEVDITLNQFSALSSFVYNVGGRAFANSTLLRKLNAGDYDGAGDQLLRWVHGGGRKLPGLVSRRKAELELFHTPDAEGTTVEDHKDLLEKAEFLLGIHPMAQKVEPMDIELLKIELPTLAELLRMP